MTKLTEKEKWEILTDQTIETHQGTTRALFQPLSKPCYCWQLEDENLTQKWNGHQRTKNTVTCDFIVVSVLQIPQFAVVTANSKRFQSVTMSIMDSEKTDSSNFKNL